MKKKGFTLIELLAVIILLAIIALIATPLILDVIDTSRRKANYITASHIIAAGNDYYAESWMDPSKELSIQNMSNIYNTVQLEGKRPATGELYVNSDGRVALSVRIDNYCYVKELYGTLEEREDCDIGFLGNDGIKPTVSYEVPTFTGTNSWFKQAPSIRITATDNESGLDKYMWCEGIDCTPSTIEYEPITVDLSDTTGTQICVIAVDLAENESDKTCTEVIKVDTVAPEISGIGDVTIAKGTSFNLATGVTYSDVTSTIESFTYEPSSIDTSVTGEHDVVYRVVDEAGNMRTATRKVIVSSEAPSITFTPEANAINSNGWAQEDFYVTINVQDNSGHGIKSFNVCTALTDTCDPENGSLIEDSSTATRLISTENNNNRICVKAIDNYDQETDTICSDAFKLDKHLSIAGTILVNNEAPSTDWYNSNLTITAVDGSDSLSGHATTTVDVSSITESTSGTTVTVTTTDNAGNSKTRSYTLKVDKTEPTVNVTKTANNNKNLLTATVTPSTTISDYTYQWYKDNTVIANATASTYETVEAGTYKVKVTTGAGKEVTSNGVTVNSYDITYNVNGGTGTIAKTTKVENVPVNLTTSTPTRTNYQFLGWSTSSSATTATYVSGASYTANSGAILYAVWKSDTGSITINSSSSTFAKTSYKTATVTVNAAAGTISCVSSNTSIATCTLTKSSSTKYTLKVTGAGIGVATITVKGSTTGKTATYTANVGCASGTLTADATKGKNTGGYVCVTSGETTNKSRGSFSGCPDDFTCSSYCDYCTTGAGHCPDPWDGDECECSWDTYCYTTSCGCTSGWSTYSGSCASENLKCYKGAA